MGLGRTNVDDARAAGEEGGLTQQHLAPFTLSEKFRVFLGSCDRGLEKRAVSTVATRGRMARLLWVGSVSGRGSGPSPAAGPPPTQHLRPAPAAPPTCSVLLLPRSCGLCGPPVTAGSAPAQGNWTGGLTAVQHPSRGRSLRGGSTPPPPNQVPENRASWRTRQEDEG